MARSSSCSCGHYHRRLSDIQPSPSNRNGWLRMWGGDPKLQVEAPQSLARQKASYIHHDIESHEPRIARIASCVQTLFGGRGVREDFHHVVPVAFRHRRLGAGGKRSQYREAGFQIASGVHAAQEETDLGSTTRHVRHHCGATSRLRTASDRAGNFLCVHCRMAADQYSISPALRRNKLRRALQKAKDDKLSTHVLMKCSAIGRARRYSRCRS